MRPPRAAEVKERQNENFKREGKPDFWDQKKKIIIETNKRKFNKKKGLIVIFAKSSHLSRKGIVIACPGRQKPSCATGDMLGIHERKNHGESCRYGNTLFLVEF